MQNSSEGQPLRSIAVTSPGELAYERQVSFESGLFRLVGWFGLIYGIVGILHILVDLAGIYWYQIPTWWPTYAFSFSSTSKFEMYSLRLLNLETLLFAFNRLFLIAASIGCLRRYSRTRLWLMTYGLIEVILGTIYLTIRIGLILEQAQTGNYMSDRSPFSEATMFLEYYVGLLLLPLIALWIATRRNATHFFQKTNTLD